MSSLPSEPLRFISASSLACDAIEAMNPADDALAMPRANINKRNRETTKKRASEHGRQEEQPWRAVHFSLVNVLFGRWVLCCQHSPKRRAALPPRHRPCSSAISTPTTPSDSVLLG